MTCSNLIKRIIYAISQRKNFSLHVARQCACINAVISEGKCMFRPSKQMKRDVQDNLIVPRSESSLTLQKISHFINLKSWLSFLWKYCAVDLCLFDVAADYQPA